MVKLEKKRKTRVLLLKGNADVYILKKFGWRHLVVEMITAFRKRVLHFGRVPPKFGIIKLNVSFSFFFGGGAPGDRYGSVLDAEHRGGAGALRRQGRLGEPGAALHERRAPAQRTGRPREGRRVRRETAHPVQKSLKTYPLADNLIVNHEFFHSKYTHQNKRNNSCAFIEKKC